jgi:hypothetical protein
MIDGLNTDNFGHQFGVVMMNVLYQFSLCIGWSGNQNRTSIFDGIGHGMEKGVILCRMAAADRIGFMMYMPRRSVWMQNKPFNVG